MPAPLDRFNDAHGMSASPPIATDFALPGNDAMGHLQTYASQMQDAKTVSNAAENTKSGDARARSRIHLKSTESQLAECLFANITKVS
jgi:hypothetical protein